MSEEIKKRGEEAFGIYLPQPLKARLVARIGIDGKNRNAIVRKAIEAFLLSVESQQAETPVA